MDELEGQEQPEAALNPEQPETTGAITPATSDSARESLESEVASSVEAASEPETVEDTSVQSEADPEMPLPEVETELAGTSERVELAPVGMDQETPADESPAQSPAQERRAAAAEGLRRGRLPQGDVPVEGGEEPAWYVIHCYSGYENKVRHNLEQRIETMGMKDRIFDVVIPTQEEIEVKEGKRRTVERHIFPGYVLVNMTLSEESWYVVRNTPGVTGFVGMGNLPTPLRPEEVSQIIKRMESEAPAVKVSFKVGERVRIIDGPFNDFRGTVSDIDMERTKVRVMVSFFGRETPVELDFLQVEKA